jgi:hypothetical protein
VQEDEGKVDGVSSHFATPTLTRLFAADPDRGTISGRCVPDQGDGSVHNSRHSRLLITLRMTGQANQERRGAA